VGSALDESLPGIRLNLSRRPRSVVRLVRHGTWQSLRKPRLHQRPRDRTTHPPNQHRHHRRTGLPRTGEIRLAAHQRRLPGARHRPRSRRPRPPRPYSSEAAKILPAWDDSESWRVTERIWDVAQRLTRLRRDSLLWGALVRDAHFNLLRFIDLRTLSSTTPGPTTEPDTPPTGAATTQSPTLTTTTCRRESATHARSPRPTTPITCTSRIGTYPSVHLDGFEMRKSPSQDLRRRMS
jgi:hypothetical protein